MKWISFLLTFSHTITYANAHNRYFIIDTDHVSKKAVENKSKLLLDHPLESDFPIERFPSISLFLIHRSSANFTNGKLEKKVIIFNDSYNMMIIAIDDNKLQRII